MTTLHRLIGVYDADGSLRGEVAYWVSARLGRRHCALCDITHGTFRERADWQACRSELPVPFDTYHRNDMPDSVRDLGAALPAVFVETDAGCALLLDAESVVGCGGDPETLVARLLAELVARGLGGADASS